MELDRQQRFTAWNMCSISSENQTPRIAISRNKVETRNGHWETTKSGIHEFPSGDDWISGWTKRQGWSWWELADCRAGTGKSRLCPTGCAWKGRCATNLGSNLDDLWMISYGQIWSIYCQFVWLWSMVSPSFFWIRNLEAWVRAFCLLYLLSFGDWLAFANRQAAYMAPVELIIHGRTNRWIVEHLWTHESIRWITT